MRLPIIGISRRSCPDWLALHCVWEVLCNRGRLRHMGVELVTMQELLGLMIGIGLSATCGFRVFVPLLGMGIACHAGHLTLAPGFVWIGSWPALIAFGVATLLEIGAYYVPWLDNLLDSVASPAAVVAGTIVTASMVGDMSPFLRWALAVVAGGGVAGAVQAGTVLLRGASTATTGGAGNPVVSTAELGASVIGTLLALLVPVLALVLLVGALWFIFWRVRRLRRAKAAAPG